MKLPWPFRRDLDAKGVTFVPANAAWEFMLPGTKIDYGAESRNGMQSSVVTSALCWIMRTFPEAPVCVQRSVDGRWEDIAGHAMTKLLKTPNPFYGGRVLMMATIMDFCFGEAFWLKVRNGGGAVVELWWIPRALIQPMWDQADARSFITHYQYNVNGYSFDVSVNDVVHFRFGMDPNNIRRGFSQLAAVMREVYIDDQAANFTAAILRNLGIIGIVFSPKTGIAPKDYAESLKKYVQENFTGDKKGQAMAFNAPTDVQVMQYNLQGFDVGPIRDISEERVCAALAIPAAVVGFGTGLQQTKVGATMREMVKLAWQGGIEPNQAIMADELDRSLLPEFQANPGLFRTHFDTSQVEALTEAPGEKSDRVLKLASGNIIKVSQAQQELGYPVDATQNKYLRELMTPPPAAVHTAAPQLDTTPPDAGDPKEPQDAAA